MAQWRAHGSAAHTLPLLARRPSVATPSTLRAAAWLRAHGRYRFLLTAPPAQLPATGGTSCEPRDDEAIAAPSCRSRIDSRDVGVPHGRLPSRRAPGCIERSRPTSFAIGEA